MSEKIREAFELWAISCHMCTYLDGVEYRHQSTEWAWMAWKASRAALVVELPAQWSNQCYDDEIMFSGQVIDAIDSAGISYK